MKIKNEKNKRDLKLFLIAGLFGILNGIIAIVSPVRIYMLIDVVIYIAFFLYFYFYGIYVCISKKKIENKIIPYKGIFAVSIKYMLSIIICICISNIIYVYGLNNNVFLLIIYLLLSSSLIFITDYFINKIGKY